LASEVAVALSGAVESKSANQASITVAREDVRSGPPRRARATPKLIGRFSQLLQKVGGALRMGSGLKDRALSPRRTISQFSM
jgi:hypothetical protein